MTALVGSILVILGAFALLVAILVILVESGMEHLIARLLLHLASKEDIAAAVRREIQTIEGRRRDAAPVVCRFLAGSEMSGPHMEPIPVALVSSVVDLHHCAICEQQERKGYWPPVKKKAPPQLPLPEAEEEIY